MVARKPVSDLFSFFLCSTLTSSPPNLCLRYLYETHPLSISLSLSCTPSLVVSPRLQQPRGVQKTPQNHGTRRLDVFVVKFSRCRHRHESGDKLRLCVRAEGLHVARRWLASPANAQNSAQKQPKSRHVDVETEEEWLGSRVTREVKSALI